jgi:predicted small secreted protein
VGFCVFSDRSVNERFMKGDKMKKILYFPVIVIATILAGCATTTTGPVAAGKNTYVISRQEGAFPSGDEQLLAEAIGEANNFCSSLNKVVKLINTHENPGPYIFGNYPKATVTFSCVEE